jgi:lipopolysaccharide/colanic/teichoic acid biosynthesis glycosyltransferase
MQFQPAQSRAIALGPPRARVGLVQALARNRYQLLGGALLGVLLPALMRPSFELQLATSPGGIQNTLIGTFVAMVAGAYLRRRMTTFPGSGSIAVVFPAFGAAYAIAIVWFFFLRLDYSRFEFAASFLLVLLWFSLVAVLERRTRRDRFLLLPFGNVESLLALKRADWVGARSSELPYGITGVVADLRADLPPEWERLLSKAALAGLPVYHSKQVAESLSGMVDIEHISENNLGSLLPSSVYLRLKYLTDVAIALVTLPLTLLVCGVAAIAIALSDGRPIFFRQTRMGLGGHPFTIFKFRTMAVGSENGRAYTTADDPRITRVGRILRRYRIDELPQIINILRGEMSWIGPRPECLPLSKDYEAKVAFYSYRHIVRPGISGWAAVHQGNVAEVDAATTKLKYDFYYVKYFSPWRDLLIAAKTVKILLTGFGAR